MVERISHKVEGDEFVIRIPLSFARSVLFAVEGLPNVWLTGFFVEQGSTARIPPLDLNRLSGLRASRVTCRPLDLGQSKLIAPEP